MSDKFPVCISTEEAAGRTVKAFVEGFGQMLILFEDGTFCQVKASSGYDGDAEIETGIAFTLRDVEDVGYEKLIAAGFVSAEYVAEYQRKSEEARAAFNLQRDREQYERLRAKFGKIKATEQS